MESKNLYELGILAKNGDELAMLEIIERKKKTLKRYSYQNEDLYQLMIIKLIEGIKNYNF